MQGASLYFKLTFLMRILVFHVKISNLDFIKKKIKGKNNFLLIFYENKILLSICQVLFENSPLFTFSELKNEFERHGIIFFISRWSIRPFLSLTEQKSCQIYMKSTLRGHLLLGNWVIRLNQQDGILCKRKTIKSRLFDRFKTQRIKKMRIF